MPFTVFEVRKALSTSRTHTSPGPDDIPNCVLKLSELAKDITSVINAHSKTSNPSYSVPKIWKHSQIVSIPKKGPSTSLDNQRGIAKTCAFAKLMNKLILNRIKSIVEPRLLHCQSGFRPGRSTTEQIMALRCIIDACRTQKRSATIVFVDFRKAFDTINRGTFQPILTHYGVPQSLIDDVLQMYDGTSASVSTSHGDTESFTTTSGVLQGDTLSPFLFIILMDYILRQTLSDETGFVVRKSRGTRYPAKYIHALAYADDIALISESADSAESVLRNLELNSQQIGLSINEKKTKVLHLGYVSQQRNISLSNGIIIGTCNNFNYLGIDTTKGSEVVYNRVLKAWGAAHHLTPIFNSSATDVIKLRLFRSAIETILCYGLESLPLSRSLCEKLDSSHRRLLRFALGIHWPTIITNFDLMNRVKVAGINSISTTIRQRRLLLIGHTLRADATTPLRDLLLCTNDAPLRRGHGRTLTLRNDISSDLSRLDLEIPDVAKLDKKRFHNLVAAF